MIEKIIVVAPTTAVPISTGLAVALKVLPAPSFSSSKCFARSKRTSKPYWRLSCSWIPGTCSMSESSKIDCALSVTGPYESTAMVTGPIPRNPNATSPKANTAGATMSASRPSVLTPYAMPMSRTTTMPSQYPLKLPATKPERTLSEAPPSRDAVTTSRTWLDSVEVNTLTNSGMMAPARVPHVMTVDSFHHSDPSPRLPTRAYDAAYVMTTETMDVSHTREVSGASKFILVARPYLARAIASL